MSVPKLWQYYYINPANPQAYTNEQYIRGISREAFTTAAQAPERVEQREKAALEYIHKKNIEWVERTEIRARREKRRRLSLKLFKQTKRQKVTKPIWIGPEPTYPLDDRIKLAQLADHCKIQVDSLKYYHTQQKVYDTAVHVCKRLEDIEAALGPPASSAELAQTSDKPAYSIKANLQLKVHQCKAEYIEALACASDLTSLEIKSTSKNLQTLSSRLWH